MPDIITIPQRQNSAQNKFSSQSFWFEECQKMTRSLQREQQENINLLYEIELLKAKLYVQQALSF